MFSTSNPFVDVRACAHFVDSLVKAKQLHKASKSPDFSALLSRLRSGLESDAQPDRAIALAVVGKLAVIVRGLRDEITNTLSGLVNQPPPPILDLPEADDRFYAAQFWRYVRPPWAADLLAECAVKEENAENFRVECVEGLAHVHPDLASVLRSVSSQMSALSVGTNSPSDSKSRRLRRVLSALELAASKAESIPGTDSGSELRQLLGNTFYRSGPPQKTKDELTEACLSLVHYCLRADLSLLTLGKVYAPLWTLKDWYTQAEWEHFVEANRPAQVIAQDLEWAIELLSRAGIADNELFNFLLLATGTEKEARRRTAEIALRNTGLPEEIVAWLSGEVSRRRSSLATENQYQQADTTIAEAMVRLAALAEATEEVTLNVLPRMRILDNPSSVAIGKTLDQLRALGVSIETLASIRSLSVVGNVDDTVEFSPLEHEFADPSAFGARLVRIIMPMVVAHSATMQRRVVRKALVEPSGETRHGS
jgi:hypothetical protein